MTVSDIIGKIEDIDGILKLRNKDDLDGLHWDIVIELLEDYRDELMSKKVV